MLRLRPKLPRSTGTLPALTNYRFLASAVWTTAEATAAVTGSENSHGAK